jgi:hypothetical protein
MEPMRPRESMLRRLILILALLLTQGVPVVAQPKVARVGYLAAVTATADAPRLEAFRQGLREFGYVEGQNLVVEYRHEGGGFGRLPELAAELVRQSPPWIQEQQAGFSTVMRMPIPVAVVVFPAASGWGVSISSVDRLPSVATTLSAKPLSARVTVNVWGAARLR